MKHVKNFAGMIAIAAVLEFLIKPGEATALTAFVSDVGTLTIDEWVRTWAGWASLATGSGLLAFIIWYLIGQASAPDFTGATSKRSVWILLSLIPMLAIVIGFFLLPEATSFVWLAVLFLATNAMGSYWIASAAFSPSRVKTAPVFAEPVRKLTDALPF
jgi:threonine/homoserine efflux transporter RhtA